MTALFPLYLAVGAAVLAPILLHLRRKMPKTQVEFSSLQFLVPTPMVTATRSKIVRWLLLLLRCLSLLLLAAMFARPFSLTQDTVKGQGRAVVIMIDRSASMQQADHWTQALGKASEWLNMLSPQDQVALVTFDRSVQRESVFTQNASRSAGDRAAALQTLACGWAGTDLGRALVEGVSLLNEASKAAEKRLVVISDFQEGAEIEALRGFAWPESVSLTTEPVTIKQTNNLAASLVAQAADQDDDAAAKVGESWLRVRLANARESRSESFSLRWASGEIAAEGHLLPGATRVVKFPRPESSEPEVLTLTGDEWPFDNTLQIAPPQPRLVKVAVLAGEGDAGSVNSPLFYLNRALVPNSKLSPSVVMLKDDNLKPALTDAGWLVAMNDASASAAAQASAWVKEGGRLLCVVTDTNTNFLKALLGTEVSLAEAEVKDYELISEIDFAHPVLKPFEDVRLRDFTRIHFWKHRILKADGLKPEVVARFDNGQPAWLSIRRGKGRIVLMLSGWQPKDSQLALSSRFVPLLFGLMAEAGISLEQPSQFVVGDALPYGKAEKPGFVKTQDGRTLAVNVPPGESRVNVMDFGLLTALGVKMHAVDNATVSPADQERIANEELESRQQYWLIALVLLLIVLAMETWLAGRKSAAAPLKAS
jgi:hypothetical protein